MAEKLKVQVLEGADNQLDLAKLEDVLKRKLIIPSYQRPYAWTEEDIEEIFQTVSNTQKNMENICFFGSIILSKKSNGFGQEEYYIIDGQQRLVSFLLILRVILDNLNYLSDELASKKGLSEQQIVKKNDLKNLKSALLQIINTVNLKREQSTENNQEKSIIDFIKNSGNYDNLPDHLNKKIDAVCAHSSITYPNELPDSKDIKFFQYIDKVLTFLDIVLHKVKFCLICITGKNSEDFAINLFNTLNTTGQPLTAFEVLKSELYTIDSALSEKIDNIQSKIIKKYIFKRKKITTHTGKLLLYLPLYRGDFKESDTLSDNKFKNQRSYLKAVLDKNSAPQLVEDIKIINNFYSEYWLNRDSENNLLNQDDQKVCLRFLTETRHDRVLPILIQFYQNNKTDLGKCVKMCTAFSSLWRAFHDGGTSGIDGAYETLSLNLRDSKIDNLNKELKKLFFKKLSSNEIEDIKNKWLQKLKISAVYKNQKLCKFLLFLAYNQIFFKNGILQKGSGVDILNIHYWTNSDYKTIEHIIPKSDRTIIGHIHTLGNLTLLPQKLNSSLGDKPFLEKLKQYQNFCSTENTDKYPYLPIIKHITNYNQFKQEEIEERTNILAELIWQTLAENWLGWV